VKFTGADYAKLGDSLEGKLVQIYASQGGKAHGLHSRSTAGLRLDRAEALQQFQLLLELLDV
jgi:hypothetical protein